MSKSSKQEVLNFSENFEQCLTNSGNDELAIDTKRLSKLVKENKKASFGFVELYCFMAQEQPAYLMTAYVVAMVYQTIFSDDTLEKMVVSRAKELNAMSYILSLKTE